MRQPRGVEPAFNAREGVRFQAAPEQEEQPQQAEFYGAPDDPLAWHSMDDAPKDGTVIEYKVRVDHPDVWTARWKITRMRQHYVKALAPGAVIMDDRSAWVEVGFWSHPITREQLSPEPGVWRMPAGFINPTLVRA